MIFSHQIRSLIQEEFEVLLYVVNHCPKTWDLEVDITELKSYKLNALAAKLQFAAQQIKPENQYILDSIAKKLLSTCLT